MKNLRSVIPNWPAPTLPSGERPRPKFHDTRSQHQIASYLMRANDTSERNARNMKRWTDGHARRWYDDRDLERVAELEKLHALRVPRQAS